MPSKLFYLAMVALLISAGLPCCTLKKKENLKKVVQYHPGHEPSVHLHYNPTSLLDPVIVANFMVLVALAVVSSYLLKVFTVPAYTYHPDHFKIEAPAKVHKAIEKQHRENSTSRPGIMRGATAT